MITFLKEGIAFAALVTFSGSALLWLDLISKLA